MTEKMLRTFEDIAFLIMVFAFLILLSLLKEEDMVWGILGLFIGAIIGYVTAGMLSNKDSDDQAAEWEDQDDGQ